MTCPNCSRPVPANEWAAYGRHEDCAVAHKPAVTTQPAALRNRTEDGRRRKTAHKSTAT